MEGFSSPFDDSMDENRNEPDQPCEIEVLDEKDKNVGTSGSVLNEDQKNFKNTSEVLDLAIEELNTVPEMRPMVNKKPVSSGKLRRSERPRKSVKKTDF